MNKYILLILLLFPVVVKVNYDGIPIGEFGLKLLPFFVGFFITCYKILTTNPQDYIFNMFVTAQLYSFFLVLGLSLVLREQTLKDVFSNFRNSVKMISSSLLNFLIIALLLSFSAFQIYWGTNKYLYDYRFSGSVIGIEKSWTVGGSFLRIFHSKTYIEDVWFYTICFVIVYFSICFYLRINKRIRSSMILFLILLFPIISVGNQVEFVNETKQRMVTISPLIIAFCTTVFSFFKDFAAENLKLLTNIKCYSLLQIALVLLVFPSILITKEKDHA